jgi:hypothetical protein
MSVGVMSVGVMTVGVMRRPHFYYTKYYNATCYAVNTHLFKTALNLLGEIS